MYKKDFNFSDVIYKYLRKFNKFIISLKYVNYLYYTYYLYFHLLQRLK